MSNVEELFKQVNFDLQFKKLKEKYKNKKIILYGVGEVFKLIKNNYCFSNLNIIGISDANYEFSSNEYFEEYKIISPDKIFNFKPDIVLITTEDIFSVEKYFHEVLFKNAKKKFNYSPILKKPLNMIINEEWEQL